MCNDNYIYSRNICSINTSISFTGAVIVVIVLRLKQYLDKHDVFISYLLVMTFMSMAIVFYIVMILVRYGVILKC